ncbi:hypothetical protein BDV18DRAFT_149477 [Aspergillus unguis]
MDIASTKVPGQEIQGFGSNMGKWIKSRMIQGHHSRYSDPIRSTWWSADGFRQTVKVHQRQQTAEQSLASRAQKLHLQIDHRLRSFPCSEPKLAEAINFQLGPLYDHRSWCGDQFDSTVLDCHVKGTSSAIHILLKLICYAGISRAKVRSMGSGSRVGYTRKRKRRNIG